MKLKLFLPSKHKTIFLVLLFIFVYAPPFNLIPFSPNKILSPIAFFYLFFLFKNKTEKLLTQKHIFIATFLIFVSILYAFLIDTSSILSNDLSFKEKYTYHQALNLIEIVPISLFLCVYAIIKLKLSFTQLLSSLITIASMQSFFALIMLLSPSLRRFILTTILKYDPSKDKIFRSDLYDFRSFGISQDYLFSFSIVQGIAIICILSLCIYNFSKYKYYLFLTPIILLSIPLNARIGFVPIIIFTVIILIFFLSRLKIYLLSKIFLFSIVSIFTIYLSLNSFNLFLNLDINKNLKWTSDVLVQGQNFIKGSETETGNFGIIRRKFLHLPQTESARIFGEGRYVFGNRKSKISSDVGYVRRIYFGGYLFSFLTYSTLIFLFIGSQKKKTREDI